MTFHAPFLEKKELERQMDERQTMESQISQEPKRRESVEENILYVKKVTYTTEISRCIWLLVGLVRSLKSSHKKALKKHLLCIFLR